MKETKYSTTTNRGEFKTNTTLYQVNGRARKREQEAKEREIKSLEARPLSYQQFKNNISIKVTKRDFRFFMHKKEPA